MNFFKRLFATEPQAAPAAETGAMGDAEIAAIAMALHEHLEESACGCAPAMPTAPRAQFNAWNLKFYGLRSALANRNPWLQHTAFKHNALTPGKNSK